MSDQRKFYRWEIGIPCGWLWEFGEDRGNLVNFSFGGARVKAGGEIPVEGADITIALVQPERVRHLPAHVIYADGAGDDGGYFGIEFYGKYEEKSRELVPIFCSDVDREAQCA